jgi:hypothetical protein
MALLLFLTGIENSIFTEEKVKGFEQEATEINGARDEDIARFYLQRANI